MKRKIAMIIGYIVLLISVMILPLLVDFYISYNHVQKLLNPEIRKVFMDQAKKMIDEENEANNKIEFKIPFLNERGV